MSCNSLGPQLLGQIASTFEFSSMYLTRHLKKKKGLGQSPTHLLCCKSKGGSSSFCERDTELCLYPIPYLFYGNMRLKLQGERQHTLPSLEHWRKSIVAKGDKHKITLFPWEERQDYVLGLQLGKDWRKSHTCDPEKACCPRLQLNQPNRECPPCPPPSD